MFLRKYAKSRCAILALLIGLLTVGLAWVYFGLIQKPIERLPDLKDIEFVSVELYDHEGDLGIASVAEFGLQEEFIPTVMAKLSPPSRAIDPPVFSRDVLGLIHITTKAGTKVSIRFYWSGKNPVVFTMGNEVYYWGSDYDESGRPARDGGLGICSTILRARKELNTN